MTDNKPGTTQKPMALEPQFHLCGESALLMNFAQEDFDLQVQRRLWSLTDKQHKLRRLEGIRNIVPGVNNVLVTFDPFCVSVQKLRSELHQSWSDATPLEGESQLVEVPVVYDTTAGSELEHIAQKAKMSCEEVITLHTSVDYWVSCIGCVPGFAFMSGLPPRITISRKSTPTLRAPVGSVGIGGSQTGIIPIEMPTGWHLIGRADISLFDPSGPKPCLLAPGDRVRFTVQGADR